VSPQPYTHLAFEGFQYAKEKGSGNEYNGRVLRAFFQEEQDIGDSEVLTQLAEEVGLNREQFREVLETRQYKEAHQTALYQTHKEAGISAVPTFIVEGQRLQGLQSKETLERVIDFAQRP
jgi:predicted DsbA family dithiol-disulfide isomerase